MSDILLESQYKHFPNDPVSPEQLERFQTERKIILPYDMRLFYLHCNGASLFRRENDDPPFIIMKLSDICRARVAIYGIDSDEYGPSSHYVFCDRGDGDFVAIDLDPANVKEYPIIDCWHEAYPDPESFETIATSFSEFLRMALQSEGCSFFW